MHCAIRLITRISRQVKMSEKGNSKIPAKVLELLIKFLPDDESTSKILYFLVMDPFRQRILPVLQFVEDNEKVFGQITQKLVEETKILDGHEGYRTVMVDLWNNYLKDDYKDGQVAPFDRDKLEKILQERDLSVAAFSYLEAIAKMPLETQQQVFNSVRHVAPRFTGSLVNVMETAWCRTDSLTAGCSRLGRRSRALAAGGRERYPASGASTTSLTAWRVQRIRPD